jgi:signal transduction histidine kinase/CheY-like chemotaxis protein
MILLGKTDDKKSGPLLNEIAHVYSTKDYNKALSYIDQSISISDRNEDIQLLIESYLIKSIILHNQEEYKKAIDYCYLALDCAENNSQKVKVYLNIIKQFPDISDSSPKQYLLNKALYYDSLEKFTQVSGELLMSAIEINPDGNPLELFKKLSGWNLEFKAISKEDMIKSEARAYKFMKRQDKAIELQRTYIELTSDSKNNNYFEALLSLGCLYNQIFQYENAIQIFELTYNEAIENDSPQFASSAIDSLAKIKSIQFDFSKSIELCQQAIKLRNENGLSDENGYTYYTLGLIDIKTGNREEAKESFKKGINCENNIQLQLALSKAYFELLSENDPEYLNAYRTYNESRYEFNELNNNTTLRNSELFAYVSAKEEQYLHKNDNLKNTGKGIPVFLLVIFIIVIIILFMAFIFAMRSRMNQQVKFNKEIIQKNKQINEINEELENSKNNIEELLIERTVDLQTELKERKKFDLDLKKALKRAEDANYVKNAFLSNMSHEIRTPLNGIIGFASLLETELSLIENEELFEYANSITLSGERLMHLLNNIIDISRIEANDMQIALSPCDINDTLKGAADLFKFKANEKGLKFNIKLTDNLPEIFVDHKSLSKICSDIIDNSVKYTETGFINLVTGYNDETEEVFIRVKDTGIGIDPSYLPDIFEAFRQESLGFSRAYQGAGLGLPLAKRMIEMMHGRIEIESEKAAGTLVSIYFPPKHKHIHAKSATENNSEIGEQDKEVVVVTSSEEISVKDPYIFVVEDDRMNRLVIKKMIQNEFRIELAEDGDKTMKMIKEFLDKGIVFDIMLFDINLPSPWDGVKLMQEIRKLYKEYNSIPFIAQTAYAMTGDKERLLEAGFDDYIPKPINKNILINSIKNQLKNEGGQR